MDLKYVSSIAILGLLIVGLALLPVDTILAQAQFSAGRIVGIKTAKIYPGEPVAVSVEIYVATIYTVKLCNDYLCTQVWASITRYAPTAGIYDVVLTLPTKLPGAADKDNNKLIDVWVVLEAWGTTADSSQANVYPKVVVTPPSTTIVDAFNKSQSVKVEFLGYLPNDNVSSIRLEGPISYTYSITKVTIGADGYGSTTVDLLALTGGGLPRGTYKVTGIGTSTNLTNVKPGSLEIRPQVVISPKEGNGRCDATSCELTNIIITGYGFDPNVNILKVELLNINFTNVKYTFTLPSTFSTDGLGSFKLSNLKQYTPGSKGTNMTAGLYVPRVYEAPLPQTLTNQTLIDLGKTGTVRITESAIVPVLGTRASISATSYVDAKLDYVLKQSRMSYVLTEVLRVNISYGGKLYQLAANIEDTQVRFALYNITTVPYVTLFSGLATPTYDRTLGAYVANVSFNILPTVSYILTSPTTPGEYRYWATFYSYSNQILLLLREWSLVISKANVTVTYTNKDTGTTVSKYYAYPTNMSTTDYSVKIPTLTFTDADIKWSVDWSYDASAKVATIKVTAQPTVGPSFEFRNVYYIVRPLLVLLATGVVMPGDTVTIAAYGYGPGAAWGYPGYNTLYVYWEKIVLLGTFTLGKDGNLTFKVSIPKDASFGVHYIWGVDKWGYEYTLAVIIGARAYWYTGKTEPKVSAGLDGKRVEVCPCPESTGIAGLKYCAQCATYVGVCDYLGDIIKVVIAGLSPGETLKVYFGGILMKVVKANKSVEEIPFVVPTVPEGTYTITVVGTASGTIIVDQFFNTTKLITASPIVVPKLMLLDLNKDVVPVLVGPGLVRVVGTGFPIGVSMYAVLFNGTEATYALNAHVARWIVDASGRLTSPFTKVLGIYVPVLEPGAYAVSLVYILPNGTTKETLSGYVYVINNVSILATSRDLSKAVSTLSSKMDSISAAISGAVSTLSSKIDGVSAAIATLSTKVDSAVADLKSKIDASIAAIRADIATLSAKVDSAVGTLSSKIDAVSSKVDSAVADLKSRISASTTDIRADIAALSKSLSSAVTTLTSKIDAVSGKVDTVSSKVDTLRTSVDAISGTLKTVSEKLSAINTTVAGLKSDVTSIKTDVASVKSDVASVKTDVSSVKSDVASLKSDVTSIKTDVASVKSDVASVKSNVSGLPGKIDGTTIAAYIAVIFALLAFIMATLGFITIRKVTGAPKGA